MLGQGSTVEIEASRILSDKRPYGPDNRSDWRAATPRASRSEPSSVAGYYPCAECLQAGVEASLGEGLHVDVLGASKGRLEGDGECEGQSGSRKHDAGTGATQDALAVLDGGGTAEGNGAEPACAGVVQQVQT